MFKNNFAIMLLPLLGASLPTLINQGDVHVAPYLSASLR